MMMRKVASCISAAVFLFAICGVAHAENRTLSWSPVTQYTDNAIIDAGAGETYTAYWTTDAGLDTVSLRQVASGLSQTSTVFDPSVQGMTRGATVYFTIKVVLGSGMESALSPAYAWVVPQLASPPTLSALSIAGPASVNEGSTGAYTATATWSDGTTTSVVPAWSVTTAYATIAASGVLTAAQVAATQSVTVSGSYASGGVTQAASQSVTVVNVPRLPATPRPLTVAPTGR